MKFILTIIFTLIMSVIINYQNVFAAQISNSDQSDIDMLEENVNSKDKENPIKTKTSEEDIFGDEQTFPFVAGLGKNAAH